MEITTQRTGEILEMTVEGRLDAYWADHLSAALEEAVRAGADRIRLNMAGVTFMSSVGIRVLLKVYKQLQRINGAFSVSNPSEAVKTVLELAGLQELLAGALTAPSSTTEARVAGRHIERGAAAFEVFDLAPGARLRCRVVGSPEPLAGCRFAAPHCRRLSFPDTSFGLGLGALGHSFEDSQARFGEFLAAGGAAAYLPTDGTNVPDYVVATEALVPELSILYAVVSEGTCAHLARFGERPGSSALKLSELAGACLQIAAADAVGVVMVAESAGLMGAALRRSPALEASAAAPFTHPQIREWLSFTPERAYPRSLALVVGVAARAPQPGLHPLLRPMGSGPWPAGHFHAAAFSYRPLQKGLIDLRATVSTLFEAETLQGVLHLLNDDREIVGAGESEFVRGACWIGALADVVAESN
jgi:anti-anti-sigma factor